MGVQINVLNRLNNKGKRRHNQGIEIPDVLSELDEDLNLEELNENIQFHFSEDQLDQQFLISLKRFLSEFSYRYSSRFLELLKESQESLLTQEIIDYILEHGFDYPKFDIYYGDAAIDKFAELKEAYRKYKIQQHAELVRKSRKFKNGEPVELEESELDESQDFISWPRVEDNHVFIVFNLPAPLAYYWRKYSFEKSGVQGSFIEWGHFYHHLQNEVVYQIKEESDDFGLYLDRLNQSGVHLNTQFYYLWDIYPKNP